MRLYRIVDPELLGPYWGKPCQVCDGHETPERGDESAECFRLHFSLGEMAASHVPTFNISSVQRCWFREEFIRNNVEDVLEVLTNPHSRCRMVVRSFEAHEYKRVDRDQALTDYKYVELAEEVSADLLLSMFSDVEEGQT